MTKEERLKWILRTYGKGTKPVPKQEPRGLFRSKLPPEPPPRTGPPTSKGSIIYNPFSLSLASNFKDWVKTPDGITCDPTQPKTKNRQGLPVVSRIAMKAPQKLKRMDSKESDSSRLGL